ncbi:hypothetical protein NP603_08725 [Methylomonas sp. SURF-1]|uniref:Uncharacterized protein n=1 Tax=Methylomonas aurea TaxID=2952224 RepID=A0ABT1UHM5_9GAMM|nr:hypothetical protein [Methylomonas sp. SURF-1]MCQ8181190.1 hypothetical protein [Methylomonas sp. SURF-1]
MASQTALLILIAILSAVMLWLWRHWRRAARADFIRRYAFPAGLFEKLQKRRPQLARKDCELTARALRQFFLAYLHGGRNFVSMPSQLADDLWHEFILYTRHYEQFCRQAFGGFLHHTPAVVLSRNRQTNAGLRRVWWQCCREENINPRKPSRLPLLFALDSKLQIADGFSYVVDCRGQIARAGDDGRSGTPYCGADFADSSFDGDTDGFGDDSGSGDSGGDGDSGGCGGGCGGGGD